MIKLLCIAALVNIFIALLHITIIFIGVPAYKYFGAPTSVVRLAEQGYSLGLIAIMLFIAFCFFVVALYGFSAAGVIYPLPFLKPILFLIGVVFSLRGAIALLMPAQRLMLHDMVFSCIALIIGVIYFIGWCFMSF